MPRAHSTDLRGRVVRAHLAGAPIRSVVARCGYRVNSRRGVRFRQCTTRTLRDHLVRGYTVNGPREFCGVNADEISRFATVATEWLGASKERGLRLGSLVRQRHPARMNAVDPRE